MNPRTLLSALVPLPARRSSRVAAGLLSTALLAATAGCEDIADIHDVTTGTGGTGGAGGAGPTCKEPTAEPAADCDKALENGVKLEIGGGLSDSGCTVIGPLIDAEIPFPAGSPVFAADDPDTLLIVGEGAGQAAALYSVPVARDADCHIAAIGKAVKIADVPNADGVATGPDGALFFGIAHYPPTQDEQVLAGLGRMKAGSGTFDETFDLMSLGLDSPVSGLGFVPEGFPGAGTFAFTSFPLPNDIDPGEWYSADLAQEGKGPLDVLSITPRAPLPHTSSFVFLGADNGVFPTAKVLVTDYSDRTIRAYDIGPGGVPDTTGGDFTTLLTVPWGAGVNGTTIGPWGTVLDPVTGDLLVVLYELHRLIALRGFSPGG